MAEMSEEEFEVLSPPILLEGEDQYKYSHSKGILTYKQFKGWSYEATIQHILKQYFISFNGNPLNPKQWIKYQGQGVDLITEDLLIECKSIYRYRFSSGNVRHDLLPRFQKIKDRKLRIMLTNDKTKITRPAIRLLEKENIKLWNIQDLLEYYKIKAIRIIRFFIKYKEKINIPSFTSINNFIKHDTGQKDHTTHSVCSIVKCSYSPLINGQKYQRTRLKQSNNQTSLVNSNEISSGYYKYLNFKEYQNTIEKINKAICDIVKYRLIELDPREYFDIHLSNPNLPSIVNEENFWYFIYKTVDHYTWNSLIDLSKYCVNRRIDHFNKMIEGGYNAFIKRSIELLFNMSEYEDEKLEIPSCRLCKKFKHCTIMDDLKRLKCLKRRVYLQEHYDNEDREYSITLFNTSFNEEDYRQFWNIVRRGEVEDLIKSYNNENLLYYIKGDDNMKDKNKCNICGKYLKSNESEICSRCKEKINVDIFQELIREGGID